MAGVLAGSRQLAHIERLGWDEGLKKIFGIERFVSDTTLSRFFRRFEAAQVQEVFERFDALATWADQVIGRRPGLGLLRDRTLRPSGRSVTGIQFEEAPAAHAPSADRDLGGPAMGATRVVAFGQYLQRPGSRCFFWTKHWRYCRKA
jgi:hypothetical protein